MCEERNLKIDIKDLREWNKSEKTAHSNLQDTIRVVVSRGTFIALSYKNQIKNSEISYYLQPINYLLINLKAVEQRDSVQNQTQS